MSRANLWRVAALVGTVRVAAGGACAAPALPAFDLKQADAVREWQPTHDIVGIEPSPEGMVIAIDGPDPYSVGPARDYPEGQPLWLRIRLKSEQAGTCQIFYFNTGPTEENSVRFACRGDQWEDACVPLPAMGPGWRLRIDPPGIAGKCVVASISFEPRKLLAAPEWPKPEAPNVPAGAPAVRSGELEIRHAPGRLDGFAFDVAGTCMGTGCTRPLIGYLQGEDAHWLDLAQAAKVAVTRRGQAMEMTAVAQDADGARWEIRRRFSPARVAGAINVETTVTVNKDRDVIYLPMFVVLPGMASFGAERDHGLFAGLEYLDKPDTSSSEADIIGPGSQRQVPDSLRITFPLMALQAQDRYVGLIWEMEPQFSAVFDSPDRLFHSGGHVMGVLFPGSDGHNRVEGSLLPYWPQKLAAGKPLTLMATLIGGRGKSIVPAVQQYVALRGLPPVPNTGLDAAGYAAMAAGGWLDSKIRDGDGYRHAYWPGNTSFGPQPAADAPVFMEWLAGEVKDPALAARLRETARAVVAGVAPADRNSAGVSHVRYPVPALVYGSAAEAAARAREAGRGLLRRFEPDGSVLYKQAPDRLDYGKTHFAPDANGLTAQVVSSLLESAVVSGDADLVRQGLRVLRALDRFAGSAPRGAQTWEVPLHTPDILASAYLVKAYVFGYELTGEAHFLDQARYWAWTGVPFTYLVNPTGQPVGPYATIAVFGATQWRAPDWMGLPVQWCGLVYSDALYRLVRDDPKGPWRQIADGISASGVQQSWDAKGGDLQCLLPDSFNLRPQTRNPVAINPGTVEANAIRLYGGPALYDYHISRLNGVYVHAPGALVDVKDAAGRLAFTVRGWLGRPYDVLVSGLKAAPQVRVDGKAAVLEAPNQWLPQEGVLVLHVQGSPKVEITMQRLRGDSGQ